MNMSIILVLFFAVIPTIVSTQEVPYKLGFTDRAPGTNTLTLQCKGQHGTQVDGASFYRNGQNITNSSCLTSHPTSKPSELRVMLLSQECDGFFSCGINDTLSVSKELYACPVRNVTEVTTIEIEKGSSILLTCNFLPSPIKNYTTTWFIGVGSNAMPIATSEYLQSYLLQKPDQSNSYYCQIQLQSPTNSLCSGPSEHSSIILVRLKQKYEMPTITEDLNYTRNENGNSIFSVTSRGTNLTHRWYKNGGLINGTGDSILEISDTSLRVKETNGSLRIAYVVSNVDYDNTSHSMRQTFGVYSHVSCTSSGITEDSMEIAVPIMVTAICILIIFCLILGFCVIYLWKKDKSASKKKEELIKTDDITATKASKKTQYGKVGGSSEEVTRSCEAGVEVCIECNNEQSMDPNKRLFLDAIRIVKDCSDYDFLKLLEQFLLQAKNKEKYNNECRELCRKMIRQVDTVMQKIEPKKEKIEPQEEKIEPQEEKIELQERDGTRRIGLDGSNEHLNDDQHHRYEQYQDIRKILQEIASQQESAEC